MRDVVLYSRPGCMFCAQVGSLLREAGIPFRILNVPERAAQDALVEQYDARAFPIVLVDREYIGGFTHVVRLHSQGRLKSIVSDDDVAPETAVMPRRVSSVDPTERADTPVSGTVAAARGSLADFAKLGEYLQRTKKV